MNPEIPYSPILDITRGKHGGNPESEAAHATLDTAAIREKVMDVIKESQLLGVTADEIAAMWDCSPNHCAPRISELLRDKRVFRTGQRRVTRSGCSARVVVAAEFASDYIRQTDFEKKHLTPEPVYASAEDIFDVLT